MKHTLKERLADVLVEEFITRLSESTGLKEKFIDMTGIAADELMEKLVEEVNGVVEQYRQRSLENIRSRNGHSVLPEEEDQGAVQKKTEPHDNLTSDTLPSEPVSTPTDTPTAEVKAAMQSPMIRFHPSQSPEGEEAAVNDEAETLRNEYETLVKKVHDELSAEAVHLPQEAMLEEIAEEPDIPEVEPEEDPDAELVYVDFAENDIVYLHAASSIPDNEEPRIDPVEVKEHALDGRTNIFAFDYERMRFYLSRLNPLTWNVNKKGMLLLGKDESMRLAALHNDILNRLRCIGPVLPFDFSTVTKGRNTFFAKIDRNAAHLKKGIDIEMATMTFNFTLYARDGHIAELVGSSKTHGRQGRERVRASYSSAMIPSRFDIKQLEKILQKEKQLAATIHEELDAVAEGSSIDFIAGLGSGSSEEWKPILKASYETREDRRQLFFALVRDLQQQHSEWQLMFELTGHQPFFALS